MAAGGGGSPAMSELAQIPHAWCVHGVGLVEIARPGARAVVGAHLVGRQGRAGLGLYRDALRLAAHAQLIDAALALCQFIEYSLVFSCIKYRFYFFRSAIFNAALPLFIFREIC